MQLRRVVAAGLLLAWRLSAQVSYGHITGRVTDATGAVVPAAAVQAVNVETNVVASTKSNSEGNFEVRNLIPGRYRLIVELEGFKRYERGPMELRVGDTLNIPVSLEVGTQAESVLVTAEAPLLESATAAVGQVIDERRLLDLPMPSSNPGYLTQFAPNVISYEATGSTWTPEANPHPVNFSAAGAPSGPSSNEMALDGMPNMRANTMGVIPPPEVVQEVRVSTMALDASLGHFMGAQVNMVLKSGTNTPHGDLVFTHSSRPFNSVPFFTNRSIHDLSTGPPTKEKVNRLWPFRRYNRYRGTGGGPVYIPKIYDGRNRTFWQYAADYLYMPYPTNGFWTVPTLQQREGDFSDLLALGSQYQLYDPFSTTPAPGGLFQRQPLPGNIIPPDRINPISKQLLKYWPAPNATAATADFRNNYTGPPQSYVDYDSHFLRIDQMVAPNHRLYGSYNQYHVYALQNIYFGEIDGTYPVGGTQDNWHHAFTLDDTLTLRPDLVLNFRYGVVRFSTKNPHPSIGFDLAALGLDPSFVSRLNPALTTIPQISITGYQGIGGGSGGFTTHNFHNLFGSLMHMRGNHSLKFGGEARLFLMNSYSFGNVSPSYSFDTAWLRGPFNTSPAAPIGQGFASFLYGLPTGGSISNNASQARASKLYAWYVQDDWKVTPKLTVNLGLRHELEVPVTERFDRTTRGFDMTTPNPIQEAARAAYALDPLPELPASQFSTPGGYLFANVGGVPRRLMNMRYTNFMPRIGIAYQVTPRVVVRAGYGIFFGSFGADRVNVNQSGFSQSTSLVASLDNGQTFVADIRNPFPDGILEPVGSSLGMKTFLGRSVSSVNPDQKYTYMQRWSFNIQREFGHRVLVEAGYTGNRGTGIGITDDLYSLPIQYLSRSPQRDQAHIDWLAETFDNPFRGMEEFAGSSLVGNTMTRSQLLRAFPHFTGVSTSGGHGTSWYHALHVRAEKRFSHGYTIQASYTWSKLMEATERPNGYYDVRWHSIAAGDRPQHLGITGIYELPFGRGRRFVNDLPGWADRIVNGWQIQAVYLAQSGPPIGFGNIIFYGNLHDIVLPRGERKVERWFNTDAGFERDSAKQLAQNYRTFPLRLTGLRADGYNLWNMSVIKNIQIRERVGFEVRAEAKNAFNHPNFGGPNTNVTAGALFGQVTGSQGDPQRQIVLQGKLKF